MQGKIGALRRVGPAAYRLDGVDNTTWIVPSGQAECLVDQSLVAKVQRLTSLRGVVRATVLADAYPEEWGAPSGVLIETSGSDAPILPTMVSAPHDGFRVIATGIDATALDNARVRDELGKQLRSWLCATSELRRQLLRSLTLDELLNGNAEYLAASTGLSADGVVPRPAGLTVRDLPATIRRAAASQIGSCGRGAHYVSFEKVTESNDAIVSPGELVVVVHVGPEGMAHALKNTSWVALARAAISTGYSLPSDVQEGLFAVPSGHPEAIRFVRFVQLVAALSDWSRLIVGALAVRCLARATGQQICANVISDIAHAGVDRAGTTMYQFKGVQLLGTTLDDVRQFHIGGYPGFILGVRGDGVSAHPHGRTACHARLATDAVLPYERPTFTTPANRLGKWRRNVPIAEWMAIEERNVRASLETVLAQGKAVLGAELWPVFRFYGQPKPSTRILRGKVTLAAMDA